MSRYPCFATACVASLLFAHVAVGAPPNAPAKTPLDAARAAVQQLRIVMEPTTAAGQAAVVLADKAVMEETGSVEAWKILGDALWLTGLRSTATPTAVAAYAKAVSLAPSRADLVAAWAGAEFVAAKQDGRMPSALAMSALREALGTAPNDPVTHCVAARRPGIAAYEALALLVHAKTCVGTDGHSLLGQLEEEAQAPDKAEAAYAATIRGPWLLPFPERRRDQLAYQNVARLDLGHVLLGRKQKADALRQFRWVAFVQQDAAMSFGDQGVLQTALKASATGKRPPKVPNTPEGTIRAFEQAALDGDAAALIGRVVPVSPLDRDLRATDESIDIPGITTRCRSLCEGAEPGCPGSKKRSPAAMWPMCVLDALGFPDVAYTAECHTEGTTASCKLTVAGAPWSRVDLKAAGKGWLVQGIVAERAK